MLRARLALLVGLLATLPSAARELSIPLWTCYSPRPVHGVNLLVRIKSVLEIADGYRSKEEAYAPKEASSPTPQTRAYIYENEYDRERLLDIIAVSDKSEGLYSGPAFELTIGEACARYNGKSPSEISLSILGRALDADVICYDRYW